MAVVLSLALLLSQPAPPDIQTGWASQYAPDVMERVVANRLAGCCGRYGLPLELPPVDGYVAAREPGDIGRLVWLRPVGATAWERFLVVDCAGRGDRRVSDGLSGHAWMTRYNVLVEVDYQTAVRWNTVGRGIRVELSWSLPEPERMQ